MPEVPTAGPDPIIAIPSPLAAALPKQRLGATEASLPPSIVKSLDAFAGERERLFRADPYRWVAYRDGIKLRITDTQTELYRYCLRELGLGHDDFIVRCITPEEITEVEDSLR